MSRYSSLHAFLIIFALFGSSVAAPEKHTVSSSGEGGSDGAGILSLTDIKNWRNKAGKGLSALGSKIGKLWKVSIFVGLPTEFQLRNASE